MKYPSANTGNLKLLAALLLALPLAAVAAPPGAGSILQQIQPVEPPEPLPSETGLKIEQPGAATLPPSAPFLVKGIRITGNTLFGEATLHILVADAEGKAFTLEQMDTLAARITQYYHSHGYPLARAIIPAQTIQDGIVTIEVIEARYGKIKLDNHSRVNDKLLLDTLSTLQGGQAVEQKSLDHSLLLLSDIPGVTSSATLLPGETVGTSDLNIQTAATPRVTGTASLDNYGNRYTGRARAGGTVNLVDPLHHGDLLSLSGLSSGSGMNYGRGSYESLLDGSGTRLGGAYSALHYILGDTLAPLNAHGTAQVSSLWAKHPFIRSQNANLYGQLQYDNEQLKDHIDASSTYTDRTLANWTASLAGDLRDGLLSGGANSWNLGLTSGRVGYDNAAAQAADSMTTKTQGNFSKWNANLARLQSLSQSNGLYMAFSGQWANRNLDAAEKMIAGGPYTVRAYDMGVIAGDTGYLGTVELRHDLGAIWQGQWQTVAFIDSEHVQINKNAWAGAGVNSATLSGAGVGLDWTGQSLWSARAYVAAPIGSTPALVGTTSSVIAWVQVNKGF